MHAMISLVTGVRISVRVQPRARRDELVEMRDGVLVVRVAAPALEGRANGAVCRLLARRLQVAPSRITVVRGQRSRDKLIHIEGIDQSRVDAALKT
jgi:uncharacterized protein (TIGR00251 family)